MACIGFQVSGSRVSGGQVVAGTVIGYAGPALRLGLKTEQDWVMHEDPLEGQKAAHMHASIETWLDVIDRYPEPRFDVAHNKNIPIEILAILADDPDDRVRSMVSVKLKLTKELLLKMVDDPSDGVRDRIDRHHRSDEEVLLHLIYDEWNTVSNTARKRLGLPLLPEEEY